ncbi:MAG: NUDIX domain-containing protein [Betaproteobacteria bacterium]|nr:NUDIX domain-containing protein [Betaproteobacteria bacterium]
MNVSSYKIPESVLVVIYTTQAEVLLIRRADAGTWQSVTGSKDAVHETWEETARREVMEETLCLPHRLPVQLNPTEHTEFQWHAWRDAADLCFSPSNAEAILMLPRWMARDHAN